MYNESGRQDIDALILSIVETSEVERVVNVLGADDGVTVGLLEVSTCSAEQDAADDLALSIAEEAFAYTAVVATDTDLINVGVVETTLCRADTSALDQVQLSLLEATTTLGTLLSADSIVLTIDDVKKSKGFITDDALTLGLEEASLSHVQSATDDLLTLIVVEDVDDLFATLADWDTADLQIIDMVFADYKLHILLSQSTLSKSVLNLSTLSRSTMESVPL